MYNNTYQIRYSDELYHYGVKGMKWGVRNYQNYDGSYKSGAEGRYGGSGKGGKLSRIKRKISSPEFKRKALKAAKIAGTTAAVAGAAYLAYRNRDAIKSGLKTGARLARRGAYLARTGELGNSIKNTASIAKYRAGAAAGRAREALGERASRAREVLGAKGSAIRDRVGEGSRSVRVAAGKAYNKVPYGVRSKLNEGARLARRGTTVAKEKLGNAYTKGRQAAIKAKYEAGTYVDHKTRGIRSAASKAYNKVPYGVRSKLNEGARLAKRGTYLARTGELGNSIRSAAGTAKYRVANSSVGTRAKGYASAARRAASVASSRAKSAASNARNTAKYYTNEAAYKAQELKYNLRNRRRRS